MYRNFEDFLSSPSPQEKEYFINVSRESIISHKHRCKRKRLQNFQLILCENEIRLSISGARKSPVLCASIPLVMQKPYQLKKNEYTDGKINKLVFELYGLNEEEGLWREIKKIINYELQ